MDGNETQGVSRLEAVLRQAHARHDIPAPDPRMIQSVLSTIKAEAAVVAEETASGNGLLWRMAAGAGLLAADMVVTTLVFGTGFEELGRFLFYDPNGQVLVSLLGV